MKGPLVFIVERGNTRNRPALDPRTRSGKKLAELMGVADMTKAFACVNLVDRWPGVTSRGGAHPNGLARRAAGALWLSLPAEARLVFVGRRVGEAFDPYFDESPFFSWERLYITQLPGSVVTERGHGALQVVSDARVGRDVVLVPHPSGMNRWWNDPKNRAKAARFFRGLALEARGIG
jgi:hypothetical protein